MRSLTVKLVLAFLLTSIIGIALASVFIRQLVVREFDDYVVERQRSSFIVNLGSYYAEHGTWAGVERWLRESEGGHEGGPGGPSSPKTIRFAVADKDGTAVIPPPGMEPGARIDPAQISRGTPITLEGELIGTVIAPEPSAFRNPAEERYLARTTWALAGGAAVAAVIALVFGVLLARVITRPVRELTAATEKIARGNLRQQVPVRSRDELGVLAAGFNRMSADLAHANQLRRQMTADIAHDLRTPLTVIAGYLESLRDQVLKPTPERLSTMYDETQFLLKLVDDLHTLSLVDAGELALSIQPVPPRGLLQRVADAFQCAAEQHGVDLLVRADESLPPIWVDPERMARALGNLVANALRYTPPEGRVELIAREGPSSVDLVVADTGQGIAPEHLPNIFERFYRADPSRSEETGGSGLGLAIVRSIVETHGGRVNVESAPGRGTTFTIAIPQRGGAAA